MSCVVAVCTVAFVVVTVAILMLPKVRSKLKKVYGVLQRTKHDAESVNEVNISIYTIVMKLFLEPISRGY